MYELLQAYTLRLFTIGIPSAVGAPVYIEIANIRAVTAIVHRESGLADNVFTARHLLGIR